MQIEDLLTVSMAAARLRMTRAALKSAIRAQKLKVHKIGSGRSAILLITPKELNDFRTQVQLDSPPPERPKPNPIGLTAAKPHRSAVSGFVDDGQQDEA